MRLNKKFIYILIILILYSIFRLAIVFTSTDLANIEECYRHSLPLEIINGLRAPLLEYQYTPYEGVYVPIALFTTPFMLLFGIDYIVIKIHG